MAGVLFSFGSLVMWFPLTKLDSWVLVSGPLDNEPEFTRLLGMVLDNWSELERELGQTLMHLLQIDEVAADVLFYSIVSNHTRIKIVDSLVHHLMPDGPEKDGLKSLLVRCNNLNKKRNDIVHGQYHSGNPIDRMKVSPSARKDKSLIVFHPVSADQLIEHNQKVRLLALQLSFANAEQPELLMPTRRLWS